MNNIKHKLAYTIEPDTPIESTEDITEYVTDYFAQKNESIHIISNDKVLVFSLNNDKYVARTDKFFGILGGGRDILSPYPLYYFGGVFSGNIGGFKYIYIYKILE